MMNKIENIFKILKKIYPDPKTELNYSTPFQLMMAVVLSAQTTDKQVNKVTPAVFSVVKTPSDLLKKYTFSTFQKAVSGVNYYKTKAKNLWKMAEMLKESSLLKDTSSFAKGEPTYLLQELQKLPGVGIKSAKVIAHVLWDLPVIAVDTHVHRVVNRWGIVTTTTPEETSVVLEDVVSGKYKDFAHHAIVLFGRYICTAKNPKCETCGLKKYCKYYGQITS